MYCCILDSLSLRVSSSFDKMFSNSLANFDLSADEDDDEAAAPFDDVLTLMPEEEDDDDDLWLAEEEEAVVSLDELFEEGSTPRLMNGCGSLTAFTVLAMLRAAVWPPFCFFIDST